MIEVKNLSYAYSDGTPAVQDISITFPEQGIFAVMGFSSLQYLTILIPVGVFLAILLALARMYRDSEMAALMACGIGNVGRR